MRQIRNRNKALIKVGTGLAALLNPEEVRSVEKQAAREGMIAACWCAAVIRERLKAERERRHGAQGEPATELRTSSYELLPLVPKERGVGAGNAHPAPPAAPPPMPSNSSQGHSVGGGGGKWGAGSPSKPSTEVQQVSPYPPSHALPLPVTAVPAPATSRMTWATMSAEQRMRLAAEWNARVPYPADFATYTKDQKLAWMSHNWPLTQSIAPVEETEMEF